MILSKDQIIEAYETGRIFYHSPKGFALKDFTKNQSVDIHIGSEIYDVKTKTWIDIGNDIVVIPKNTFFLVYSEEFIGTTKNSQLHPQWYLRSTLARMGLGCTKAGFGDVGFHNRWCMVFFTYFEIELKAYDRIGQISFTKAGEQQLDYVLQTGNYQQNAQMEMVANWKREDILPKEWNK
jgi:deoxycytidine triphosphate deaminase